MAERKNETNVVINSISETKVKNMSLSKEQAKLAIVVFVMLIIGVTYSYIEIGIAPLLIIGIPGLFGYLFWYSTYLKNPTDPSIILPPFLATVAGFEFHVIEEFLGNYSQAISRIFNFAWTQTSFFVVIAMLTGVLSLISIGLYYRKPIAGFIAILFVVTRFAEILLFVFPFIKPQLQPEIANSISQNISGSLVSDMPNYYYHTVGNYYFPGMYTWVLTLIPAIFTVYRIWKANFISDKSID